MDRRCQLIVTVEIWWGADTQWHIDLYTRIRIAKPHVSHFGVATVYLTEADAWKTRVQKESAKRPSSSSLGRTEQSARNAIGGKNNGISTTVY